MYTLGKEAVMTTSDTRVRFRDLKPYFTVDSLEVLQGPAHGVVELPVSVFWSGSPRFDLNVDGARTEFYQSVLSNGSAEHIARYLNRELLLEVWPTLPLDQRVVETWHAQHPHLAALRGADGRRRR